uniref:FXYD domain-containing ion transport regulator n=1 Tax=Mola mola TaxID=94237 RepID=A0A3Q3W9T9_MOLML
MGHLTVVAVLAAARDPLNSQHYCLTDYERLRIVGLICACLLVTGGLCVILYGTANKCHDNMLAVHSPQPGKL